MKFKIKKYRLELIGTVIGGGAGYLYWFFFGCATGSCAISSSPINSFVYGAFLGWFFFGIFSKQDKETQIKK